VRLYFHRHLVGGATHATRTNLEGGTDVIECLLQHDDGILAAFLANAFECTINDALSEALFTGNQNLVNQLRHYGRTVDGVSNNGTLRSGSFTRHYFFSIFAP